MFGTLIGLFFMHRKQRDQEREKRLQYWREQVNFLSKVVSKILTERLPLIERIPSKSSTNEGNRSCVHPLTSWKRE